MLVHAPTHEWAAGSNRLPIINGDVAQSIAPVRSRDECPWRGHDPNQTMLDHRPNHRALSIHLPAPPQPGAMLFRLAVAIHARNVQWLPARLRQPVATCSRSPT